MMHCVVRVCESRTQVGGRGAALRTETCDTILGIFVYSVYTID